MAESNPTRVLVVDPSIFFYQGVSDSLCSSQFQVVAWARDRETAEKSCRENAIDLALIGYGFSPRSALELCGALCSQREQIKIILMSECALNSLFQQDAFHAGVDVCLPHSISHADLRAACHDVVAGKSMETNNTEHYAPPRLSPRELEILRQVAQNKCDKDVAHALNISVNTVRNHMQNILRKLEVNNREDAVWRTRHWGLI